MDRGKFIALEGGEGSGKDTMIDRLKAKYADRKDIIFTREPGGTELGEKIRSLLMTKDMNVKTELMLFVAARAQLISEVIAPALAQDKTVISNRFGLSTVAYQIYGRQRMEFLPFLREITNFAVGNYKPLYIYLDVLPEVGLKRVENRGDGKTRFDAEDPAFHHRVREGYLSTINAPGAVVIDANQPLEEVWSKVELAVSAVVGVNAPSQ